MSKQHKAPAGAPEDYSSVVAGLRKVFHTGKTKSFEFRVKQLQALQRMVQTEEKLIIEALAKDLGRSQFEAVGLEVLGLGMEIEHVLSNLSSWMEPTYTKVPAMMAPATNEIVYEPYGVCLVIGAFNYPIMLTLSPFVGAIMAGNVCVIKPSEMSSHCEALLATLIPRYLDNECYKVICGGIDTNKALLELQWDKIFFTGSIRVGKIVAAAAAKHLTPTCLELGGKSPCIIDESVTDLTLVTQRIMWGKCANAGQTCIAPDYVLCHEKHYDAFLDAAAKMVKRFYGEDPAKSPDLCRIISKDHARRLKGLLDDGPGRIVYGGAVDVEGRYVQPTIIAEARLDSKLMSDEIFGPLLPVIKVSSTDQCVDIIRTMEKPLAIYIYGKNRRMIDQVTTSVTSGGVLVNDCLFHFGNSFTPFGGVGPSGMGGYHGKFSFEAFSHRKTVMRRDDHMIFDVPVRYPPYTAGGLKLFRAAATKLPALPSITPKAMTFAAFTVVAAVAAVLLSMKYTNSM